MENISRTEEAELSPSFRSKGIEDCGEIWQNQQGSFPVQLKRIWDSLPPQKKEDMRFSLYIEDDPSW